ncbi:alpha/beta hydrolase [Halarchaeum sp. P4]|uniref:alpha/beta hydrolase n=1 Tax=Halarchaeum sp. P4 TaxID=3421639 RepID=UPI003EBC76E5
MTEQTRRTFLRTAAATTAALGVVGTGRVAAKTDRGVPLVSTRGDVADDGTLTDGASTTGYDTDGHVPGVDTDAVDDLFVYVHGWNNAESDARTKFDTADAAFSKAGYTGTLVGFTWDSDVGGGVDMGWEESKDAADLNGPKLAAFCRDYADAASSPRIHLVSHSLGARVLFGALRALRSADWGPDGQQVTSVHLLGAAVDNETPTAEDTANYRATRDVPEAAYNYHSEDDDTLRSFYNAYEVDQALGETGFEDGNTVPDSYDEYDATDEVGSDHSGYTESLADQVVSDAAAQ